MAKFKKPLVVGPASFKKKPKESTRQIRIPESTAQYIDQNKLPGQSIGGYIQQLINQEKDKNGHSNTAY